MSEEEKKETFREAKILEILNHPNIIRFREVYKTKKEQLCIVMDYADGKLIIANTILCIFISVSIDGDLSKKVKLQREKGGHFSEE